MVIDEINRGNIAKVFGELYFLLEYRGQVISTQYASERFAMPDNLFFIGTMNTADRSIALMDAAIRRRFYFVEFFPDRDPIQGLLKRWLAAHAPDMRYVADLVEKLNQQLGDRQAAVGPSHFMKKGLNRRWLDLIWKHAVMPHVEELFFGDPGRVAAFELDAFQKAHLAGPGEGAA